MSAKNCTAAVLIALAFPAAAQATCSDLLPAPQAANGKQRAVTSEDLIALRDIGSPDVAVAPPESPLAVSPDGKRLAFVISRADRETNSYCRGLVVIEANAGRPAALIDTGGEFVPLVVPNRGLLVNVGAGVVVTPVWSPDGRSLAYRKRVDGRTEAWIAAADGSGARRAVRLGVDAEAVAWSADGQRLVVASRPGYADQAAALEREGSFGYLYDDRFQPNDDSRPAMLAETRTAAQSVDLASDIVVKASDDDARRLPARFAVGGQATLSATRSSGGRAWLEPDTAALGSPMRVHVQAEGRGPVTCSAPACLGSIKSIVWIGDKVVFQRREGWANSVNALYVWSPEKGIPQRTLSTEDELYGCVALAGQLACLVENATTPRRLVRFELPNGRRTILFDPNPEFRNLRLGTVRRLKIRNTFGLDAWADLVIPPGYRGGRVPMVVVQYFSRGFLRGSGGDEYPVHASAARGIAVLSIQRPQSVSSLDPKATTSELLNAADMRDWAERRSLLDVIERGIREAVKLGIADPARLGITGQSDGATSSIFAIINSKLFAAAAVTSSGLEPSTTMIYGGPRWAKFNKAIGYPDLGKDDPGFWANISLARNATRANVPILIQAADREYLLSLELWAKLKQAHYPVEMFVFPDEFHNKWQPAHRYAVYRRNLDWFDYWLAGKRDDDRAKVAQYIRWDELTRQRDARSIETIVNSLSR